MSSNLVMLPIVIPMVTGVLSLLVRRATVFGA